jgi:hypothetical protein
VKKSENEKLWRFSSWHRLVSRTWQKAQASQRSAGSGTAAAIEEIAALEEARNQALLKGDVPRWTE